MYLADLFAAGLAIGCVYSLVALGFAMIIRATGIIHFAQGELLMLGSMSALSTLWLMPRLPAVLVLACGMIASSVLAVAMEFLVYRPLRLRRVPLMNVITATVGMSILCINAARIVWGSEPLRYPELFSSSTYRCSAASSSASSRPSARCTCRRRTRTRSAWCCSSPSSSFCPRGWWDCGKRAPEENHHRRGAGGAFPAARLRAAPVRPAHALARRDQRDGGAR